MQVLDVVAKPMRNLFATLKFFSQVDNLFLITIYLVLVFGDRSKCLFQFSFTLNETFAFVTFAVIMMAVTKVVMEVTMVEMEMTLVEMNVFHNRCDYRLNDLLNNGMSYRLYDRLNYSLLDRLLNNGVRNLIHGLRAINTVVSSNELSIDRQSLEKPNKEYE